jgi:hypothetical protein
MRGSVDNLLRLDHSPVLTVTVSLDRRRPRCDEGRIRFRNAVTEARARVVAVSNPLLFPVRDDASLGATAAGRHLVQGLRRSPGDCVLVISDRATRLFEAVRDDLEETVDHRFPMSTRIARRDRRAGGGPFARSPGRDDKERQRRFYRAVDRALTEAIHHGDLSLVLVGVRRSTNLFAEVSHNTPRVVGHVDGAHDDATPGALGRTVGPIMQAQLERRRAAVVDQLAAASARGGSVTGIGEVWQLGQNKRVHLLIVEDDHQASPA